MRLASQEPEPTTNRPKIPARSLITVAADVEGAEVSGVQWLEHDNVPEEELPDWARQATESYHARPFDLHLGPRGVVLTRRRRSSAVPWRDVLVLVHMRGCLLLAAARRPPLPPWFELGGNDLDELEAALRARLDAVEHRGYRERPRRTALTPPDQVLTAVLSRQPLPGAVEIPAATPSVTRSSIVGATIGGSTLAFYGMMAGAATAIAAGSIGLLGGGLLMAGVQYARKRAAGRVLVLTPDAFVAGLDGNRVRAVAWSDVGGFSAGSDLVGADALEVRNPGGEVIARVAARFFGAPLDVIVAVAEAYRERASAEARPG